MTDIRQYEEKMWQAAKDGDKTAFAKLVSADAVMVCGGYRCSGAEYGSFIGDFGIASYEIKNFETVLETDTIIQVHYIVRTIAATPEYSDMAGLFHVTSTWENRDSKWTLIFNMDSRLPEM